MIRRIRALNESESEDSSDEDQSDSFGSTGAAGEPKLTREAEEAIVQEKYKNAMIKLASDQKEEAKAMFQELLDDSVLKEVEINQRDSTNVLSPVYYATCKNLAVILSEENDHSGAIKLFIKALKIDDTEVLVWYKLGVQAFKVEDYWLARTALEQCLDINPEFWPCLDNTISLMYIIGDYPCCLLYIERALNKQNDYLRGLVIKDEIFRQNQYLENLMRENFARFPGHSYGHDQSKQILDRLNSYVEKLVDRPKSSTLERVAPEFDLTNANVVSLGRAIVTLYQSTQNTIKVVSPLDLTRWKENIRGMSNVEEIIEQNVMEEKSTEPEPPAPENKMDVSIEHPVADPIFGDAVSESDTDEVQIVEKVNAVDTMHDATATNSELDTPRSGTSSPSSIVERPRRGRWKRRSDVQGGPSVFKRRSTRLIPGFSMEDPEAFGPLTTKPISLQDQLRSYLPAVFKWKSDRGESMKLDDLESCVTSSRTRENGEVSNLSPVSDDFMSSNDVSTFLDQNDGRSALDLLWNYLDLVRKRECDFKWSDSLRAVFIDCFECWTSHSQFLVPTASESNEQCGQEGRVRLLYVECLLKKCDEGSEQFESPTLIRLLGHLTFISTFRTLFHNDDDDDDDEWSKFRCRVDRVNAVVQENRRNYDAANWNLVSCCYILENCRDGRNVPLEHCGTTISLVSVQRHMERLERASLFASIEETFARDDWRAVVDILASRFTDASTVDDLEVGRYRQYEMLLVSLRRLEKIEEAAPIFVRAIKFALALYCGLNIDEKKKWWATMDNLLSVGEWIFKNATCPVEQLSSLQIASVTNSLIEIVSLAQGWPLNVDDISESCWLAPWLILYGISSRLETKEFDEAYANALYEKARSSTVVLATRSLMILLKCHQELGQRKLCMARQGSFLIFLAEEIQNAYRHPVVAKCLQPACADHMLNTAEQCFYCLYKYPPKKKRHLEEHSAASIELDWTRAHLLFDFVKPDSPPEFDDNVYATGVSAEAAQLLHSIQSMVPRMLRPDPFEKQLSDFFKKPAPDEFPQMGESEPILSHLYHLLADYYLKTKDIEKAAHYYQLDLCVSADRFDSWAGLAMARSHLLNTQLNSMELTYSAGSWDWINGEAKAALYCFEEAARLKEGHYVLLVEYSSLAYVLHSFFSRSLKHVGDTVSEDIKASLTKARDGYLTKAEDGLTKAALAAESTSSELTEKWIQNYLRGKVAEKRKSIHLNNPTIALDLYRAASFHLQEDGAQFPDKIRYNNPQRYSVEALEVFYRVHACTLKWLLRGIITDDMIRKVYQCVAKFGQCSFWNAKTRLSSQSEVAVTSDFHADEMTTCPADTSDLSANFDQSNESVADMKKKLIQWCSEAFQLCLRRFSNHFKSYYWLAYLHVGFDELKDYQKCRQILLGPVNTTECQLQAGLFQTRKTNNYFDNIWRIPSDDINRSGSFSEHIFRCLNLLCDVLENLLDHESLTELIMALQRKPLIDKQYLREPDRKEFVERASSAAERVFEKISEADALLALYRLYLALYKMQAPNKNRWGDLIRRIVAKRKNDQSVDLQTALAECASLERKRVVQQVQPAESSHNDSCEIIEVEGRFTEPSRPSRPSGSMAVDAATRATARSEYATAISLTNKIKAEGRGIQEPHVIKVYQHRPPMSRSNVGTSSLVAHNSTPQRFTSTPTTSMGSSGASRSFPALPLVTSDLSAFMSQLHQSQSPNVSMDIFAQFGQVAHDPLMLAAIVNAMTQNASFVRPAAQIPSVAPPSRQFSQSHDRTTAQSRDPKRPLINGRPELQASASTSRMRFDVTARRDSYGDRFGSNNSSPATLSSSQPVWSGQRNDAFDVPRRSLLEERLEQMQAMGMQVPTPRTGHSGRGVRYHPYHHYQRQNE